MSFIKDPHKRPRMPALAPKYILSIGYNFQASKMDKLQLIGPNSSFHIWGH